MVLTDSRKLKAKLPPMVGTKCCAACVLHDPQSDTPPPGLRRGGHGLDMPGLLKRSGCYFSKAAK